MNTAHFDTMSIIWDENPNRMKMADNHVAALRSKLKLEKSMHLLDYGCGTGLVSLRLLPFVGSVIGLDTSKGMAEQFQKKIEVNSIPNCKVEVFNPATDLLPVDENSVDVIVSTMAFHHIPDIAMVLNSFFKALKLGGQIGIIDLETEDGSFHDSPDAGEIHHGFAKDTLLTAAKQAGFKRVSVDTAYIHKKEATGKEYPMLLLYGQK